MLNNFIFCFAVLALSMDTKGVTVIGGDPSGVPSGMPTGSPSGAPTSSAPTGSPTSKPFTSSDPTGSPTGYPTGYPTVKPFTSSAPTGSPTLKPTTGVVGCSNVTSIDCDTVSSCIEIYCINGTLLGLTLNGLTGKFPSLVGLEGLLSLDITGSNFDPPTIPTSISTLVHLQKLNLVDDNFQGTIPSFLSDMSSLSYLDVSGNKLDGTVPASLGVTDTVSRKLATTSTTASLLILNLANNQLTGSIPSSLCAENLTYLNVSLNTGLTCYASCLSTVAVHDFGHLFACTETPTTVPTSSPTVVPTSLPTHATKDCIEYLLFDSFGDGWSTAKLTVYSSTGSYDTYSVDCGQGEIVEEFCFSPFRNKDGDFVVIAVTGYKPKNPWEIVWQSYNTYDGKTYTGSYHTTMTYVYSISSSGSTSITLASITDEMENDKTCQSCVDYSAKTESKKPPTVTTTPVTTKPATTKKSPAKKSPSSRTPPASTSSNQQSSTTSTITPPSTTTNTRTAKKSPASNVKSSSPQQSSSSSSSSTSNLKQTIGTSTSTVYIAPDSGVKRSLWRSSYDLDYDLSGSWYSKDESETDFYVIDSCGSLAYSGTYCGQKGGECKFQLEDGIYTWRVSGAGNPYSNSVGWDFCGMSGAYSNELKFTVSDGKCYPDDVYDITAYCAAYATSDSSDSSTTKSEILLEGSLVLHGVTSSQQLSHHEEAVLHEAVIQEIKDARFADIQEDSAVITTSITTVIPSEKSSTSSSRRSLGRTVVNRVDFSVKLSSAVLTPDEESINDVKVYLTRAMSSSLFVARIVSHARAKQLNGLSTMTSASILSIDVTHTTRENIIESAVSSITVIISSVIGLAFGTLLAFYLFKSLRSSSRGQLLDTSSSQETGITLVDFKEISGGGESTSFLPQNLHNANISGGSRVM